MSNMSIYLFYVFYVLETFYTLYVRMMSLCNQMSFIHQWQFHVLCYANWKSNTL